MSLVTLENVSGRGGWKVTPLGRLVRPIRMRPEKPLPDQISTTTITKGKGKQPKGVQVKKRRRTKEPPVRARRRTIDPLKYSSQHIKGIFLENAAATLVVESRSGPRSQQMAKEESSDESTSDEDENAADDDETDIDEEPSLHDSAPIQNPAAKQTQKLSLLPSPPTSPPKKSVDPPPDGTDLAQEKHAALDLLQSLFGNRDDDDWGDKENLGSDVDMDELAERGQGLSIGDINDDVEVVPMSVDDEEPEVIVATEETQATLPVKEDSAPAVKQAKLKDLFAPREEDGMLIGTSYISQCAYLL